MENRECIPWNVIVNFMVDAFKAAGVPYEDAMICADVLAESDRSIVAQLSRQKSKIFIMN